MKKLYTLFLIAFSSYLFSQTPPETYPDFRTVDAGMVTGYIKPLLNDSGGGLFLDTFFFNPSHANVYRINYTSGYNFLRYASDSVFFGLDTVKYIACNTYGCDTGLIFVAVNYKFYDSYEILDINNISARFNSGSSNFWDMVNVAGFEAPKGSGINSIFGQGLWFGGRDASNGLHLAAQTYRLAGGDFYPGPVMDSTLFPPGANGYLNEIEKWNRLWKINKAEIDYHISNWNQPGYTIPQVFLDWPAHGQPQYGQAADLAPFFDYDNNGIYNAANGDYPLIKGDQSIYFIANDYKNHESGGIPLKVEIHGLAYAFNCPIDSALEHTVFVNYRLINRSSLVYNNTYIGLFADGDIGDYSDDYIASDVQRGSFYFYNGDDHDEDQYSVPGYGYYIPAQSATILAGPLQDADGFDNPLVYDYSIALSEQGIPYEGLGIGYGDGIADNERTGLSLLKIYANDPIVVGDPANQETFYNSLSVTDTMKYIFPGNSDPLGWGSFGIPQPNWNETGAGSLPGDRRGLGSCGPFTFEPGETAELDIAFVFGRDYQATGADAGVLNMKQRIDAVREMFNNDLTPCGDKFSTNLIPNLPKPGSSVSLYPNPAREQVMIFIPQNIESSSYMIYNTSGKIIQQGKINSEAQTISLKNFSEGIYLVRILNGDKIYSRKFVKN